MMGGVTLTGKVYSLLRTESLIGLHSITFLTHLLQVAGKCLLVVWDRSPIHRRREVQEFLATGAARLIHIEPLPPYAPDLNPVEWRWHHLKGIQLGNVVCLDLEELHLELHLALEHGYARNPAWCARSLRGLNLRYKKLYRAMQFTLVIKMIYYTLRFGGLHTTTDCVNKIILHSPKTLIIYAMRSRAFCRVLACYTE